MDPQTFSFTDPTLLATIFGGLFPAVLGGVVSYLKPFMEPPGEFRNRINLRKSVLLEQISTKHAILLSHARRIDSDELLRGDNRTAPDYIGEYNSEVFRLFTVLHRLERLKLLNSLAYTGLILSVAVSVIFTALACFIYQIRPPLMIYSLIAIVFQVTVIIAVFLFSQKLEQFEDIT